MLASTRIETDRAPREQAADIACDTAARLADPYGTELIAAVCERPHLGPEDVLRASLLARGLEALGLRASRWRRQAGLGDIDHAALAGAVGPVADILSPPPPAPLAAGDPPTPGPINVP